MKYLVLFWVVLVFSSCATTNDFMVSESGKCHAKCMMESDLYETSTMEFIEYTGDNTSEDVTIRKVQISPASTRWERRKADKNCLSKDPEDCLVWCLVEVPGQYITVLEDTTQSSNWKMTEIKEHELIRRGGYAEWIEVLCENDVKPGLHKKIKNSLYELGIYNGKHRDDDSWNKEAKKALESFQRDNSLPIGYFNIPTMEALGVEY